MGKIEVRRDGETQETFASGDWARDQNDAFKWLLRHQPMSTDWAQKYEGWSVDAVPDPPDTEIPYHGTYDGARNRHWRMTGHPLVGYLTPGDSEWRDCENGSRVATCYHTPRCPPLNPAQTAGSRPFGRTVTALRIV